MLLRVKRAMERSGSYLAGLAGLGLLFALSSIAASLGMGYLSGRAAQMPLGRLGAAALGLLCLFAVECGLEWGYYALRGRFLARGRQCLQLRCVGGLARASMPWLQGQDSGQILSKLQNELQTTAEWVCQTLPDTLLQAMRVLLFAGVMLGISLPLALLYLAAVAAATLVQVWMSKPIQGRAAAVQQARAQANGLAREILTQRTVIKAYRARSLVLQWYRRLSGQWLRQTVGTELVASPLKTLGWVCGVLPSFLLCVSGALLVQRGTLELSAFLSVYFLADLMLNDCMHVVDLFLQHRKGRAAAQGLWAILEAPAEEEGPAGRWQPKPGAPVLRLEHVSFRYRETGPWVLHDLDLAVAPGEKVALVGESGSGKSTVLRLLQGFLEPQQGRLLLEGVPYGQTPRAIRRQQMAAVPQFPFLFAGTLWENVDLGQGWAQQPEPLYRQACIQDFLKALPQGDRTMVGEGGQDLSGGQRQRVALARGLAKEAPLLLLDEATSALDPATEKQVMHTLAGLPQGQAVLAVTHRLAGLAAFDRICVMEQGRIVEQGSLEELLGQEGAFAKLWRAGEGALA